MGMMRKLGAWCASVREDQLQLDCGHLRFHSVPMLHPSNAIVKAYAISWHPKQEQHALALSCKARPVDGLAVSAPKDKCTIAAIMLKYAACRHARPLYHLPL